MFIHLYLAGQRHCDLIAAAETSRLARAASLHSILGARPCLTPKETAMHPIVIYYLTRERAAEADSRAERRRLAQDAAATSRQRASAGTWNSRKPWSREVSLHLRRLRAWSSQVSARRAGRGDILRERTEVLGRT